MYQSENFATSSKFRAARSLLLSSYNTLIFFLLFQPTTPFFEDLFILPDSDADSSRFHDKVSRPGIWNDSLDTMIGVSMLSSKDEDIARMKNYFLIKPKSLKPSQLKDRVLPEAYGDDGSIDLLFVVLMASN